MPSPRLDSQVVMTELKLGPGNSLGNLTFTPWITAACHLVGGGTAKQGRHSPAEELVGRRLLGSPLQSREAVGRPATSRHGESASRESYGNA